jgi:hypothetical protein
MTTTTYRPSAAPLLHPPDGLPGGFFGTTYLSSSCPLVSRYLFPYLPIYMHTYMHTYIHTHLPSYLGDYLLTYLPNCLIPTIFILSGPVSQFLVTYIHPTNYRVPLYNTMYPLIHTYIHTYTFTYMPTFLPTNLPYTYRNI